MNPLLIMMMLKMGPWAENEEEKKDTSYTYSPFSSRPDKWYETWWAAGLFVILLLVGVFGLIFVTGWLIHGNAIFH